MKNKINKNNDQFPDFGYIYAPYIPLQTTTKILSNIKMHKNCKEFYNDLNEETKCAKDYYYEIKSKNFRVSEELGKNPRYIFPISKITTASFYGIYNSAYDQAKDQIIYKVSNSFA